MFCKVELYLIDLNFEMHLPATFAKLVLATLRNEHVKNSTFSRGHKRYLVSYCLNKWNVNSRVPNYHNRMLFKRLDSRHIKWIDPSPPPHLLISFTTIRKEYQDFFPQFFSFPPSCSIRASLRFLFLFLSFSSPFPPFFSFFQSRNVVLQAYYGRDQRTALWSEGW